ncbi:hypothetical protein MAR_003429 [Mya arenaria]|uniref:Uncharacterized protein n=1 Tax=Mya arenaria TaxID=6604 RepID=A0ABY7GF84_MYAAR|nr:uncharacterized protein LOC128222518 [Mya arenaria]WAR29861.1 hypothetical protein MAR_003429 [Mya arenaria]
MELLWVIIGPIVGLLFLILITIACCYARRKCEKQRKRLVGRSLQGEQRVVSATLGDGYNRRTDDSIHRLRDNINSVMGSDETMYINDDSNIVAEGEYNTYVRWSLDLNNFMMYNSNDGYESCGEGGSNDQYRANKHTGTKQPTVKHMEYHKNRQVEKTHMTKKKKVVKTHVNKNRQMVETNLNENRQVVEPNLNENMQVFKPYLNENRQGIEPYLNENRKVVDPNLTANRQVVEPCMNDNDPVEESES